MSEDVQLNLERYARMQIGLLKTILVGVAITAALAGFSWGTMSQRVAHLEETVYGRTQQQWPVKVDR